MKCETRVYEMLELIDIYLFYALTMVTRILSKYLSHFYKIFSEYLVAWHFPFVQS